MPRGNVMRRTLSFKNRKKKPVSSDLTNSGSLRSIMKRQPTQVEEKPKSDVGFGSGSDGQRKKRRRAVDVEVYIGYEDSYPLLEFEPDECLICGQITTHGTPWCPYKEFVPHDASLPPGIQRVCRCCGKRDGHPGEDWEACAILKRCTDCGTLGEHWNGDSDCPTKTGKPRCTEETEEEKPDSYKQTGRIFLFLDEDED